MKKLVMLMVMAAASLACAVEKPNIVLIFIDDMGYGDIGPFGNTVNQTPELDRMANEGMKLTDFYVSNTACTPSRSALLTGCYADRVGMDGKVVFPGDARGLNPEEITIADMLKARGYATACFGKWHVGDQPEFMPLAQGFDEYAGIPYSNDMWPFLKSVKCPPLPYIKGNKAVAYIPDGPNQALLCKAATDEAVDFIKRHRNEPFFIYVPHSYIHGPRFARKELFDKAEGNVTRAQIEEVDWSTGQILKAVREEGLSEKTLVIFMSDNGGSGGTSMGPLRGGKGGPKYEGHMRTPTIAWWPGTIAAGSQTAEIGATIDLLPTFAKLAGAKVPADRVIDGRDISSLLLKPGARSPHKLHYYEYDGIRRGPWKLVRLGGKKHESGTYKKVELYNLDDDIGEKNNVADEHSAMVKELNELLDKHMKHVQSARRPAAFVDNPKPFIDFGSTGGLPTLVEYFGLKPFEVGSQVKKTKVKTKKKKKNKKGAPAVAPVAQTEFKADPDDILMADFEGDSYGGWKVEGEAFGTRPAIANVTPRNKVTGYIGKGLVNTYINNDKSTGKLTSPEFTIERKHINFLIGAGNHKGKTCINLLVDPSSSGDFDATRAKVVRTAVGCARKDQGREVMLWHSWDVAEFSGKKAVLQIVDDHTGGWGHINIDHIIQSGKAAEGAVKSVAAPVVAKRKKQQKQAPAAANLIALSSSFKVNNTHLIVPVANAKKALLLGIYVGDKMVQNFKVALPFKDEPYWQAAYPLKYFGLAGKQITVKPIDGAKVDEAYLSAFSKIRCGDNFPGELADDYAKPYRNQFHVSTRRGWNNDPNGMVYHNGKYHLYYQHNPFGIGWGNMHWGHFESTDLIHWKETPIALYQKTVRDMMFSGGGFVDFNNSAGLGKGTQFAAFTSTGRGECLAYSKDDGLTFTELPENPVVEHRGRDPQVFWYEPESKWVMAVYDTSECAETEAIPVDTKMKQRFANCAFYESRDLRNWKRTGAFTDPDRMAVHECPQLFKLPVIGKRGESRWVIYGAQNRYSIGCFDGKTFKKESGPHGSRHGAFYAAQTFSDVPDGRRIQIGWVKTAVYVGQFPDQLVNQSFTLPHELTLVQTPEGIRMAFNPVREVEKLRGKKLKGLGACKGELTEVLIEFEKGGLHELVINGIDASFEGKSARIFTDRTFNEVYADGGLYYEVRKRDPKNFESTETVVKNGKIKSLKVYRLKSIWK